MSHVQNNVPNVGSLIKLGRKSSIYDFDYGACFTQLNYKLRTNENYVDKKLISYRSASFWSEKKQYAHDTNYQSKARKYLEDVLKAEKS